MKLTIGIPQAIMIFLMLFSLILNVVKNGEDKESTYSASTALIAIIAESLILYWGGFFN